MAPPGARQAPIRLAKRKTRSAASGGGIFAPSMRRRRAAALAPPGEQDHDRRDRQHDADDRVTKGNRHVEQPVSVRF